MPTTPCPAELILYAGGASPTLLRARLDRVDGRLVPCFQGDHAWGAGDQTVPRYSAVGDERFGQPANPTGRQRLISPIPWDRVTFLSDEHVGLTSNPVFVDNLLFELLESPSTAR